MSSSTRDEETPLLEANTQQVQLKSDKLSFYSITVGLVLFTALVVSVLVRLPISVFTFHPIFMTIFVVFVTEGIAILQPTKTREEKEKGLLYHAVIQSTSYISALIGASFIFYNKYISHKPHFESLHAKLGLFVVIYLTAQALFGLVIAVIPKQLSRYAEKAKSVWKYHRMFGYVLLVLVWINAQLGVRADYMYNNLYSPNLLWLHWVSTLLVFGGIINRIRLYKWGFSNGQQ